MTISKLVCGPAAFVVDRQLFVAAGPCDRQHIFPYREHWLPQPSILHDLFTIEFNGRNSGGPIVVLPTV